MNTRRAFTLIELLVVLVTTAVLAAALLTVNRHADQAEDRRNCRNNLKQLALGLILYRDAQGRAVMFPAQNGGDFLVHLYAAGTVSEPELYLCPESGDGNKDGAQLVVGQTPATANSYAGRKNKEQSTYPGVFTTRGSSETSLGSDDLEPEGKANFNHGDVVMVMFADGHVEEIKTKGDKRIPANASFGKLLDPLAN